MIDQLVATLLDTKAVSAVKYVDEKHIVRVTRPTYNRKFSTGNVTIVLTIGKPNFEERAFIKLLKKSGEKFPLRKPQLRFLPKKK